VVSTPLKNISQNGNLPQIVVKIKKKCLKPPPSFCLFIGEKNISSEKQIHSKNSAVSRGSFAFLVEI